jgi:hypothetical protein
VCRSSVSPATLAGAFHCGGPSQDQSCYVWHRTQQKHARNIVTTRYVEGFARFPFAQYGLFRRKIMVGRNAWAPACGARTRAGGSCLARVVIGPEGPRSRCRMHGGHLLSGKQTPEGRKRIGNATRSRMLAFWSDWRKAGKPPLPWRERLRTAKSKPKQPTLAEWRAAKLAERQPRCFSRRSATRFGHGFRISLDPRGNGDTPCIGQHPSLSFL